MSLAPIHPPFITFPFIQGMMPRDQTWPGYLHRDTSKEGNWLVI